MILHEHKAACVDDLAELGIIHVQLKDGLVLDDVVDPVFPLATARAVGRDVVPVYVAVDALCDVVAEVLQAQRRHLPGDLEGVHDLAHDGFHLPGVSMAAQLPDFLLHKGQRRPPGQQQVPGELRRLCLELLWDICTLRLLLPLVDHSAVLVACHDLQKLELPAAEDVADFMG